MAARESPSILQFNRKGTMLLGKWSYYITNAQCLFICIVWTQEGDILHCHAWHGWRNIWRSEFNSQLINYIYLTYLVLQTKLFFQYSSMLTNSWMNDLNENSSKWHLNSIVAMLVTKFLNFPNYNQQNITPQHSTFNNITVRMQSNAERMLGLVLIFGYKFRSHLSISLVDLTCLFMQQFYFTLH